MYVAGSKPPKKRRPWLWVSLPLLVIVGLAVAGWLLSRQLKPHTSLHNTSGVTTKITADSAAPKTYNEGTFTITLPANWAPTPRVTNPYNIYGWQSTDKKSPLHLIQVYQDTIPVNFAVNRVVAVQANGAELSILGDVSDNCATFTKAPAQIVGGVGVRARWQNVDFLCDMANTERDVVGISAPGSINSVALRGESGARHQYFITFTDNDFTPNFADFLSALQSFSVQ